MKKFFSEFREFAIKGNALDLAIGVIIGAAFKSIVDSLVNDIIMPLVGVLLGGKDLTTYFVCRVGTAQIKFGSLLQTALNFFIVAFCLFMLVKFVNKVKNDFAKSKNADAEEDKDEPAPKSDEVLLLEEIRDALKEIAENEGYYLISFFVTDVIENGSYIFFNEAAKEVLSKSFNIENLEQGTYLPGVVSRKKQMLPVILNTLEN